MTSQQVRLRTSAENQMAKNPAASSNQPNAVSPYFKQVLLITLVIQNAVLILSMRYSRLVEGNQYITTTAVVIAETMKMFVCIGIIWYQQPNTSSFVSFLHESIIVNWKDTLKLSVPAFVYALQNNLQYVAVSNLEAAVFQVLYQMKVFTTALFSVVLLDKKLSFLKWGSLVLLFAGVCLVTVDPSSFGNNRENQSFIIGVVAVAISCLSSGFAGVYFEKILKGTSGSVWLRNIQLGFFGSLAAVVGMLMRDYDKVTNDGFFFGYSTLVWMVIIQQAVGGLIVAAVVRYADNILKGFATSISIIVSALASVHLFGFTLTPLFAVGTLLVVISIYMYGQPDKPAASKDSLPLTNKN
ncbi:UDP-galactose translocator-like isoform X1 [Dysidea avara]|uniref:UDP-galactose translocator-like isoform X1 n=1 Tax=Dysidea avara TaxID=196820 RepID=UPI00331D0BFE